MHPAHIFAPALGVEPREATLFAQAPCDECGASPFGPAGAEGLCPACERCIQGKPSKTDPPLRQGSVVLDRDGTLHRGLKPRDLWPWLVGERPAPRLISWSETYKRHHWRNAGACGEGRLLVGADRGQIVVGPGEREVLRAVCAALAWFSRAEVTTGNYHPKGVQRYGAAAWRDLEELLRPHRATGLLDLACAAAAPKVERVAPEEGNVIADGDRKAASLLAQIAYGSSLRVKDGKAFWGGVLLHRVRRFARLDAPDFVSRLLGELQVSPTSDTTKSALSLVSDEDDHAALMEPFRKRADLVVSLAYTDMAALRSLKQGGKEGKDA